MQSEQVSEVVAALSKAQAQMKAAHKESTNPHFKSKYADLSEVVKAIKEPFGANGLCFTQEVEHTLNGWVVRTTIRKGEQLISGVTPILPKGNTAQDFGSALTYARRQGLQTLVGVAADDDDDGNQASLSDEDTPRTPVSLVKEFVPPKPNPLPTMKKVTPEQKQMFLDTCKRQGYDVTLVAPLYREMFKVERFEDLTPKQAAELLTAMESKMKASIK